MIFPTCMYVDGDVEKPCRVVADEEQMAEAKRDGYRLPLIGEKNADKKPEAKPEPKKAKK